MIEVVTEEGAWQVRKPTGREIFLLQKVDPENMNSEQSYEAIKKILEKVILNGPSEYRSNGNWDIDKIPADTFLELFFGSCQSTLEVLRKRSQR